MIKTYQYVTEKYNETQDCEIEQIVFNKYEPYIMNLTFYKYDYL